MFACSTMDRGGAMRAVIQRVSSSTVVVDQVEVARIGPGFLMLVAIFPTDAEREVHAVVDKVANLRVFPDESGRMNRSVVDVAGSVLVVSQFTLAADLRRGRRPSFADAADPDHASRLVDGIVAEFLAEGVDAVPGVFGAMMEVGLVNDGPVTFVLDVEGGRVR